MPSNFNQLASTMNRTADLLPRAVNAIVKAAGRAIAYTVIDNTPVDTGEARSNWLLSLGQPMRGTIAPYQPYPKGSKGGGSGIGESANAAGAKARANQVINARQPGQTLFIQNNVPYIGELNDGHSRQAPRLFVDMAVLTGIRSLNGAVLRI